MQCDAFAFCNATARSTGTLLTDYLFRARAPIQTILTLPTSGARARLMTPSVTQYDSVSSHYSQYDSADKPRIVSAAGLVSHLRRCGFVSLMAVTGNSKRPLSVSLSLFV